MRIKWNIWTAIKWERKFKNKYLNSPLPKTHRHWMCYPLLAVYHQSFWTFHVHFLRQAPSRMLAKEELWIAAKSEIWKYRARATFLLINISSPSIVVLFSSLPPSRQHQKLPFSPSTFCSVSTFPVFGLLLPHIYFTLSTTCLLQHPMTYVFTHLVFYHFNGLAHFTSHSGRRSWRYMRTYLLFVILVCQKNF